jgi:hypothetical protein
MAVHALCADFDAVARKTLNDGPDRSEQHLKHARDWLAKQTHLAARTDDT